DLLPGRGTDGHRRAVAALSYRRRTASSRIERRAALANRQRERPGCHEGDQVKRLLDGGPEPRADDGAARLRDGAGEEPCLLRGEPSRRRQLARIGARDGSRVGMAGQDQLAAKRGHPRATMLAYKGSPAKPPSSASLRLTHASALAVAEPLELTQRG